MASDERQPDREEDEPDSDVYIIAHQVRAALAPEDVDDNLRQRLRTQPL